MCPGGQSHPQLRTTALEVIVLSLSNFFFMSVPPRPQPRRSYGADSDHKRLEALFGCKCFVTRFSRKLDGKALDVARGSGFLTHRGTDLQDSAFSSSAGLSA